MPKYDEDMQFRETYGEAKGWSAAEKEAPKGFGSPGRAATRVNAQHRRPEQRATFTPADKS